jgi:hypothetical protein
VSENVAARLGVALLVGCLALAGSPARAQTDCRYTTSAWFGGGSPATDYLPEDDVFRPLLADLKEPRFYAFFRRTRYQTGAAIPSSDDSTILTGVGGMGTSFGVWTRRREGSCNGRQVGLFAAVFSQFNLDAPSEDLINSDFLFGLPYTWRLGPFSARVRAFHQSSHLGDEFLLNNPDVERLNLSYEAVDGVLSVDIRNLRLYGGGGYIVNSVTGLAPRWSHYGVELRGPRLGRWWLPVVGADLQRFEENDWGDTWSVVAGPEFFLPDSSRRVRVLAVYTQGFSPFGQFFNQTRVKSFGLGLQFAL